MDAYQELINHLDDLGVIVHIERSKMVTVLSKDVIDTISDMLQDY